MNKHTPPQKTGLSIEDARAYTAATQLAELTGESVATAVTTAVEERLARERRNRLSRDERIAAILEIGHKFSALPDKDTRSPDEILGYDENGLPT